MSTSSNFSLARALNSLIKGSRGTILNLFLHNDSDNLASLIAF